MQRFRVGVRQFVVALVVLASVAGCTLGSPSHSENVGYAVGPVKLTVGLDGVSIGLGRTWVTAMGTFSIDSGVKWAKENKKDDQLVLIIRYMVNGERTEEGFEIEGGDTMRVSIEGRTVQEFSRNVVVIDAEPGTVVEINPHGTTATPDPDPDLYADASTPSFGTTTRPSASTKPSASAADELPSVFEGLWAGQVRAPYGVVPITLDLDGGAVGRSVGHSETVTYPVSCRAEVVLLDTKAHPVTTTNVLVKLVPISGCALPSWADLSIKGGVMQFVTYANSADADHHSASQSTGDLRR